MSGCEIPAPLTSSTNATPGGSAPAGAPPGTCWDKTVTPAVVESVTEDVLVQPAQISSSGTVQSPPIYRTQTRQKIVVPRQETWFQMPCPSDLTPSFIASLQRALSARGYYAGPVTSQLDAATGDAIARYQSDTGLAGPTPRTLTVAAAQSLGLWTISREVLAQSG